MDRDGTVDRISDSGEAAISLFRRLAHDRAGNTLALIAASTAPLLALIGGGIDMSRSYLAQARLQQACDAGVLAARKKLGSEIVTGGEVPNGVIDTGNRFFDLNFRDGAYGTEDTTFNFQLEEDYSISGEATVNVPTTIMAIFGNDAIPIRVGCEARLNFSDTDVMFVLDTTASMGLTNPGDEKNRIDSLRDVVRDFHAQLEGSKSPQTRVRYGFVPYATNVNVGGVLEDNWVVSNWAYQSREWITLAPTTTTYTANWVYKSGGYDDAIIDSYPATYNPPTGGGGLGEGSSSEGGSGSYSCNRPRPANTMTRVDTTLSERTEPFAGPPAGTRTIKHKRRVTNQIDYSTSRSGTTCTVRQRTYNEYTQEFDEITDPKANEMWRYNLIARDVSNWRTETAGCMEERGTYTLGASTDSVDFARAFDLVLDTVPTPGNAANQWRPMYPGIVYIRNKNTRGEGNFRVPHQDTTSDYLRPADHPSLVACPAAAQKLKEMDASDVNAYLSTLTPNGNTYHDIGMIWGGRLLSPTGLFASENEDQPNKKTSRHLIFLTDGQTEAADIAYGAYGVEPLDRRRWAPGSAISHNQTIENRFAIACNEVKKRNITVWVVGFSTTMTDTMKTCAGEGHWFQADDAEELADTFSTIAKYMAELRVSR